MIPLTTLGYKVKVVLSLCLWKFDHYCYCDYHYDPVGSWFRGNATGLSFWPHSTSEPS